MAKIAGASAIVRSPGCCPLASRRKGVCSGSGGLTLLTSPCSGTTTKRLQKPGEEGINSRPESNTKVANNWGRKEEGRRDCSREGKKLVQECKRERRDSRRAAGGTTGSKCIICITKMPQ